MSREDNLSAAFEASLAGDDDFTSRLRSMITSARSSLVQARVALVARQNQIAGLERMLQDLSAETAVQTKAHAEVSQQLQESKKNCRRVSEELQLERAHFAAYINENAHIRQELVTERENFSGYIEVAKAKLASMQRERAWLQSMLYTFREQSPASDLESTRQFFCLRSMGRTATQWIAEALNAHPDIHCVHGPDLEPWKTGESRREKALRIERNMNLTVDISLDSYFDVMEVKLNQRCCGNIHGLFDPDIISKPDNFKRRYYAAVVVRHPIQRLISFMNKWLRDYSSRDNPDPGWEVEFRRSYDLVIATGVPIPSYQGLSMAERMFIRACWWMLSTEHLHTAAPVYRCEDLTSDPAAFAGFARAVTSGSVPVNDAYVEHVFSIGAVDRTSDNLMNVITGGKECPEVTFGAFPEWQKRLFSTIAAQHNLIARYHEIGYDIRYCNEWITK